MYSASSTVNNHVSFMTLQCFDAVCLLTGNKQSYSSSVAIFVQIDKRTQKVKTAATVYRKNVTAAVHCGTLCARKLHEVLHMCSSFIILDLSKFQCLH